ncbi:MAG: metallophosphoesterase N-terminal domain-containing protein, partial [Pseudomonadales bacterium]
MTRTIAWACLIFTLLPFAVAAETARGRVFNDLNNNGRYDAGEPGIAGVRVSDGVTVAQSDAQGAYTLDIADEAVIFVTKPRGYAVPVDADQLPQFYYIHQPNGSPIGLRYPGIEPTGPLPEQINFPLHAQDEPTVFEAVLIADPQPQTEIELDFIRDDVV